MLRLLLLALFLLPASALAQTKPMPVTCDGQILLHDLDSRGVYALYSGEASECVVDNRRRLIWFVDGDDLKYLELSNGKVHRIVRQVDRYIIEGNDNRLLSPGVLARPIVGGTTTLKLDSGEVELRYEPRPDPWASEREEPLEPDEPAIVAKTVLEALAQRLPSRQPTCEGCSEEARFDTGVRVFGSAYNEENCQQPCGAGWAIANSRFHMLNITDGCGDHCYKNLALYDPARATFVDPLTGDTHRHDGKEAAFFSRPTYSIVFERSGVRALVSPRDGDTKVIVLRPEYRQIATLEGVAAGWLYPRFDVRVAEARPNDFSYEKIGRDCLRAPGVQRLDLTFRVDAIGRAHDIEVKGADGRAARCVGARVALQKWHREGEHRVSWTAESPAYLRRVKSRDR